ncbi:MAG: hypothetical protein K8T91_25775 [Planctomycetes bacterium]|nr:hypothetical protein [Planctomycetota bacterium]
MAATVGNIAIGFVASTGGFTGGANKVIKQLGQIYLAAQTLTKGVATVMDTFERMDTLVDTADSIGIATDSLISLRFAAEQGASSAAGMDSALGTMNKNVGLAAMGMGRAGDTIKRLGLDVQKLKSMRPEQMFSTFADAISRISDPAEQAAVASRIFGDEGQKLLSVLRGGAGAFAAADAQAEKMGLHLGEGARQAAEAHDALLRMEQSATALGDSLISGLAPAITNLSGELEKSMPAIKDFLSGVGQVANDMLKGSRRLGFILAGDSEGLAGLDKVAGTPMDPDVQRNAANGFKKITQEAINLGDELEKQQKQIENIMGNLSEKMNGPKSIQDQLRGLGAGPETLEEARKMEYIIGVQEQITAEIEKQRQAYINLARDAGRVSEKMRTPLEELQAETKHLTEMFNAGLLDFVTFSRAAADLQKDFEKSLPKQEAPRSAGFMAEGSVAAFSNANINKTNGLENIARQQLRKAGEAVAATAQVEAAIRNGFNTINTFVF